VAAGFEFQRTNNPRIKTRLITAVTQTGNAPDSNYNLPDLIA
jgi:hypothetical protein